MFSHSKIVALVFALIIQSVISGTPKHCTTAQALETPCRCCKMDCWYSVASSATHELGHVPGQAGEDEAMATLKLIRACMINECGNYC